MPEPAELPTTDGNTMKWCTHCGAKKSVNEFHVDAGSHDGYRSHCKECRAALHAEQQESGMDPRLSAIEEEGLEALENLHRGGSYVPHTSELLESVLRPFGGSDGFGKTLAGLFYQCPPGGSQRVKIASMIVDLVKSNTQIDAADEKLEDMNERDLQRVMQMALTEYQKKKGLHEGAIPALEVKPARSTRSRSPVEHEEVSSDD